MSAGSKIEDKKQEYSLSMMGPSFISPSGHEFAFYETEENERLVIKHASGSSVEFKSDGSVFIKAIKDLHMHSSALSDQAGGFDGSAKGADATTLRYDTDLNLKVGGRLSIQCAQLDLEIGNSALIKAGRDITMQQNNLITKSAEQTAIEATKSVYIDTKELKERLTSRRAEIGSEESAGGLSGGGFAPIGGVNVINVTGNTIIENNNPSGGITISSAGYLNLVCGGERVDITGKWAPLSSGPSPTFLPSLLAKPFMSTFTNLVFDPVQGIPDPKMQYSAPPGTGGSYTQVSQNSAVYVSALTNMNAPMAAGNGILVQNLLGNSTNNCLAGNRFSTTMLNNMDITTGFKMVRAAMILLN